MHVYKELSFFGDKAALEEFRRLAPTFANGDWKYSKPEGVMKEYIAFDYMGDKVEHSEVAIYFGTDVWREGSFRVVNIVPLQKNQLSIDEYNAVLDLFYNDIIVPNRSKMLEIKINAPESDIFDPLKYISKEALSKLEKFSNMANKSTGSSHPCDEERWYDFICQTVVDGKVFDYDTIFRFLKDEDYWGTREKGFIGSMGRFAWDEEHAAELASEYDNNVRILQYYNGWKQQKE